MKIKLKSAPIGKLERVNEKILAWFYANPNARIGLNELSKCLMASKSSTKQMIEILINQNFLKRDMIGRAWILSVNQENPHFRIKKISYNLDKIYESKVVDAIYGSFPNSKSIILFGSYRKGDDNEKSDVDIAVEVLDNKNLEIKTMGFIPELGYRKNVPVNIHIFSRNKIDLNLFANIVNGIVLSGFLEAKP